MSDEAPDYRGLRWRGDGAWVDISVGKLTEMFARLDAAERERDALREAIVAVVTGSMPRKVGVVWRADKRPSKHDLCVHSQVMSCDCGDCTDEFLNGVLAALTANHSAPVVEE